MATAKLVADDRNLQSMRMLERWASTAIRDSNVFQRCDVDRPDDDEEELRWAAIERLPTLHRAKKGLVSRVLDNGEIVSNEVDFTRLGVENKKILMENVFKCVELDNGMLLKKLRARIDGVGIELPKIEVRFEEFSVEADAYVGSRALPTLLNVTMNFIEGILPFPTSNKKRIKILSEVSGIIRPSRMTLLLGPPGSGKTTLLLALAGKLDKKLTVSGEITYCGHKLAEFVPQRTGVYISEHDLHVAEMTVRETLDFSGSCLGVGTNYDMLLELLRREKDVGIKPDPAVDAFMKATLLEGQNSNLVTDYILKILGLDICADTVVGDEMLRGISGGQKKRVTIGEILVGPAKVLLMDEISTGLDSSTTFQIVKFMRQMVHVMDGTVVISLLQPTPETFDLFDDIILLSEGQIVYQGPRDRVEEFFQVMGFKCPERKGVADFLQEVTSKKDQEQYWFDKTRPYRYVSVQEFVQSFNSFFVGHDVLEDLRIPYDKSSTHPAALTVKKYGASRWRLLKASVSREWLLMKRNSFLYIFKTVQMVLLSLITSTLFWRTQMNHNTIIGGGKYLGALFFGLVIMMFNGLAEVQMTLRRLPVFYKQRDYLFYPPWAFGLSMCVLRVPLSLLESILWVCITYFAIGFAPSASRFLGQFLAYFCTHQTALSLFRFIAAAGRSPIIARTSGGFATLTMIILGGFLISKDDIQPWWSWGYWVSPITYAQNAIAVNEFLDPRWNTPNTDTAINASTIGKALLISRGLEVNDYWYWISIGALIGYSIFFNICFIAALTYLSPFGGSRHVIIDRTMETCKKSSATACHVSNETEMSIASTVPLTGGTRMMMAPEKSSYQTDDIAEHAPRKSLVLPFQPLSMSFNHVNYYVDMPPEMKTQGMEETRLQLLNDVSGAFRPGILTALVGVSGAGKTTLMDVLAGRKTGGYIEGMINISGYPKNQDTFARVSGYCEQHDIHSPHVTIYESLLYSARLRLDPAIKFDTQKMFVEEVMDLVELRQLRDALVGLPGVNGLSTEQRKRLTIAVELVANPSIIFMDEPTSGLDARSAAIIMRTVRSTVDTGRTVICTIHQPSVDIFEAFDELLLMKRGGHVIYTGSLGRRSHKLVEYFEAIPGIPKIKDGYNPATWMLEVSSVSVEARLDLDFGEVYCNSSLYQKSQELIKKLSTAAPGAKDLYFPTKYSQNLWGQFMACLWKQHWSYWRNPEYNAVRFYMTIVYGLIFGTIFWKKGNEVDEQQDLLNLMGAMYASIFFIGGLNGGTVQAVVSVERTVFYRERTAGMYSALPYALAQVIVEILYVAVQGICYGALIFFMFGFAWQAEKFFWFIYFTFMCFFMFTMCGMMLVSLTPGPRTSTILMAFFSSLWNLFAGLIVPRPLMPVWVRWYYWADPTAWTLYGIFESQFGEDERMVQVPGQPSISIRVFLDKSFGYERRFLKFAAFMHICFLTLFFFIFIYGITYKNFQKR